MRGSATKSAGSSLRLETAVTHRVGSICKSLRVITLRSHRPRQRTAYIVARLQALDDKAEIIPWLPLEFSACPLVDVHPVDAGDHLPLPSVIFNLITRNPSPHHPGRVASQLLQIFAAERCRGADDVLAKTDRPRLFCGQ